VTEVTWMPVPPNIPPGPVACPISKVGVGAPGQVKKPVPRDISMIPLVVPESIAVKSAVALPACNRLEGARKIGTQQNAVE
jgi:hypothetical protein